MAIDAAAIKAFLAPDRLKGTLQGLLKGPSEVLGVDVGSFSIKVVWLKPAGATFKLRAWGHLPLDVDPDGPPEEKMARASELLRGWLAANKIDLRQAATSVSGNAVIVRYVRLPLLSKAELIKTLPIEAEPFIPFDIKEVNLGSHILEEVVEEGQKKMETVLVAAKREVVQNRVDILSAAGVTPVIIDVDAFAIEGVHELSKFKGEPGGVLYLNVGHSVTNLSIIENGVTRVVRDILISGGSFTKAVQQATGSDWRTAQAAKTKHGILLSTEEKEKALSEGQQDSLVISQALLAVLKDLVSEMQRSVDFYLAQGPERSINRVIVTGGAVNLGNFAQALTADLKVPVDVLNPLEFMNDPKAGEVPADVLPALAVATGLALRKMKDWT